MVRRLHSARGFTLIELMIVVMVLAVLAAMAMVRLAGARVSSNEASAIGSLRAINSAEATYATSCGGAGYAQSLEDLSRAPAGSPQAFISADLTTTGILKSGYLFVLEAETGAETVLPASRTCNQGSVDSVSAYFASAAPQAVGTSGRRSFATDKRAMIYYRADGVVIGPGMSGALPIN